MADKNKEDKEKKDDENTDKDTPEAGLNPVEFELLKRFGKDSKISEDDITKAVDKCIEIVKETNEDIDEKSMRFWALVNIYVKDMLNINEHTTKDELKNKLTQIFEEEI